MRKGTTKIIYTPEELEKIQNCQSQEELFSLWRAQQEIEPNYRNKYGIEKESFIADGIIDTDAFDSSPASILFLLKEADIANHRGIIVETPPNRTQLNWYRNNQDNPVKQKEKMARMASYLLYGEKTQIDEAKFSFAFINLNKRGGGVSEDVYTTKLYFENYYPFLLQQISLILRRPKAKKYIIILNRPSAPYYKLFPKLIEEVKQRCHDNSIQVIEMWHPANRKLRNVDQYMDYFFSIADKHKI